MGSVRVPMPPSKRAKIFSMYDALKGFKEALAAKEIFVDFNVGKSTDLRAIGEPLPMRWRKRILSVGIIACGICLWQYSLNRNFERVGLLVGFFAGLFALNKLYLS